MGKHTEILDFSKIATERAVFEPYGLYCKLFKASVTPSFDRHNEIEINFVVEGTITYYLQNRHIVVPKFNIIIFWGMFPHRVVEVEEPSAYYVCTVPLSLFLSWGLPDLFVSRLLRGEMLIYDEYRQYAEIDRLLFQKWSADVAASVPDTRAMLLEMQSHLLRMSAHAKDERVLPPLVQMGDANLVEQMTLYIARNYHRSIRVADVGRAVGLHPDYANTLFKRVFGYTLSHHLMIERVTQAQRKLLTTQDSVVQIAEECGFNSISCFNAAFLKFNGCTPRDYRKHFQ
jgi:AraC-like DNA-binding protein